jgi:excisionase family DNA binding protein
MQRKPRRTIMANANPVLAVPTIAASSEVLTVAEAAALLKVPLSSIYEWTRYRGSHRGTPLPHRKIGKYLRFLRSEIDAWIVGLPQAANSRKRKYTHKNQVAA